MPRATPTGERLSHILSENVSADRLILAWDDANRVISGAERTNWKVAERWLRERRDDGTLGWVSLTVDGSKHYVTRVTGAEDKPSGLLLYVDPAAYRGQVEISTDSDLVRDAHRQHANRVYWVRADKWEQVLTEALREREEERARDMAARAAVGHLAEPLRRLLREAGVPTNTVHVTALSDGEAAIGVNLYEPEHIAAVNALIDRLLPASPEEPTA